MLQNCPVSWISSSHHRHLHHLPVSSCTSPCCCRRLRSRFTSSMPIFMTSAAEPWHTEFTAWWRAEPAGETEQVSTSADQPASEVGGLSRHTPAVGSDHSCSQQPKQTISDADPVTWYPADLPRGTRGLGGLPRVDVGQMCARQLVRLLRGGRHSHF